MFLLFLISLHVMRNLRSFFVCLFVCLFVVIFVCFHCSQYSLYARYFALSSPPPPPLFFSPFFKDILNIAIFVVVVVMIAKKCFKKQGMFT